MRGDAGELLGEGVEGSARAPPPGRATSVWARVRAAIPLASTATIENRTSPATFSGSLMRKV